MEKFVSAATVDLSVLNTRQNILDYSSILKYHGFKNFMTERYPVMVKENLVFLVPKSARRMILAEEQDTRSAKTALANLDFLAGEGRIRFIGKEEENGSESILRHLITNRRKKNFAVLTQAGKLAADIRIINGFRSVNAPPIMVYRLNPDGTLGSFETGQPRQNTPSFTHDGPSTSDSYAQILSHYTR